MATVTVDWLSVLPEIMDLIVKRIDGYRDFIVFGSVCKSFHLATSSVKHPESPPEFPLLMLSDGTKWSFASREQPQQQLNPIVPPRAFYNIFTSTTLDVDLPEAYGRRCLATNFGWLLTVGLDQQIKLLHPFSKRQIDLPNCQSLLPHCNGPTAIFWHLFPFMISKAFVSCLPNDGKNCTVFAIATNSDKLAFARLGDSIWRIVNTKGGGFDDIIYHKGLLYAVNFKGVVFRSDINEESLNGAPIAPPPPNFKDDFQRYLVELDGDLLLVVRVYRGLLYEDVGLTATEDQLEDERLRYCTSEFVIYRMEVEIDQASGYPNKWVEVGSLGNRALFLGASASVVLPSVGDNVIKGNCIYFTDDNIEYYPSRLGGGYDSGIFHVEDKTIERHYTGPSRSIYCAPLWYI